MSHVMRRQLLQEGLDDLTEQEEVEEASYGVLTGIGSHGGQQFGWS